jgi:KUP system potassium uptake protein
MVENTHAFHEKVVIVSLLNISIPNVELSDRFAVERVGKGLFKVTHLTIRLGYRDRSNLPDLLALARKRGLLDRNLDLEHASYFASRARLVPTESSRGLALWRKKLFIAMARNAASPIEAFGLPSQRTVLAGTEIVI